MSKVMTIAMIVALLSSATLASVVLPPAFSGLYQTQGMITGIDNNVTLAHGTMGQNTTSLDLHNIQNVNGPHFVSGSQNQNAFLMGVAKACANSATVQVIQGIGTIGTQSQLIGANAGPIMQGQELGLTGAQGITKIGAFGSGNALQVGQVSQGQLAVNGTATAMEGSTINTVQASTLIGEPGTIGTVGSNVTAITTQSQVVY